MNNVALNIFLAILENRPEAARQLYGALPQRIAANELATIQGRIQQAAENLKCQAVKAAIRSVFNECLKLETPEFKTIPRDKSYATRIEHLKEAYLTGVRDVEEILAKAIKTCDETEKPLGSRES